MTNPSWLKVKPAATPTIDVERSRAMFPSAHTTPDSSAGTMPTPRRGPLRGSTREATTAPTSRPMPIGPTASAEETRARRSMPG